MRRLAAAVYQKGGKRRAGAGLADLARFGCRICDASVEAWIQGSKLWRRAVIQNEGRCIQIECCLEASIGTSTLDFR